MASNQITVDMDIENRVILNVGGTRFETYKTILKKIPATRLSRLTEALVNYDPATNEYFFDRHPGVFSQILNYYRTGKLHYPINVCGPLFEEELEFWGLDSNQVEPCCWKTYTKHRQTEETLATLDRLNIDVEKTTKHDLMIKFGFDEHTVLSNTKMGYFNRVKPIIWQLFEEPKSSIPATLIACIQISMIVLSVVILWLETYTDSKVKVIKFDRQYQKSSNITEDQFESFRMIDNNLMPFLVALEYISVSWFIIDMTVRFIVCPNKVEFVHNIDNLCDFIATSWALIDFFLQIFIKSFLLQSFQVIRVARLLRLLSYHAGTKVIVTSLKSSAPVLQLLVFFMIVSSTLYGALIFYAERLTTDDPDNNIFISIPEAFWYAIVSLTTIGYGDFSPKTSVGRLFGGACAVTGVLMVGLPMTIVVEIFSNFFNHLRARSKLPKQRRRILPVEAPRVRKRNHGHNEN
ncbi:potassium voltage-gated channel Shaw-like isoform X1 [Brachionus plicatilis]|uniref:Potassium voltage-gated channel Shaw-like isoform X1 n=1 Tax=Brachionus plicatilis TaxID=10195 RepID=A0A3M7S9R7_BRAPC|nr:potassium voltage-gated channel Shaw-like isoform X1 [Brachionus plicatilis]